MTTLGPVGVLHPGAMGARVAGLLAATGTEVLWASRGRSAASAARAAEEGLTDVGSVTELARHAELLLSICPPSAAVEVAAAVAAAGFRGVYVDANAVAPATARRVAAALPAATVVDGGIVGPPPVEPGLTRLFLATADTAGGQAAHDLVGAFEGTALQVVHLDAPAPAASALKAAYAAWTKGSTALLLTVAAYARALGVDAALTAEWARSQPGLEDRLTAGAPRVAAKAWRFTGALEELAVAFEEVGLPAGAPAAAAEVYARLAPLRHEAEGTTLEAVLDLLSEPVGSVGPPPAPGNGHEPGPTPR